MIFAMKVFSISSIVNMHDEVTRACDNRTFVLCSMKDGTNEWILRESIVENDVALARRLLAMETSRSWPKTEGGRRKTLTSENGACAKKGDVLTANRRTNVHTMGTPPTPTNADLARRVHALERLVEELEQNLRRLTPLPVATPSVFPTHVGNVQVAPYPVNTGYATLSTPFGLSTPLTQPPCDYDLECVDLYDGLPGDGGCAMARTSSCLSALLESIP